MRSRLLALVVLTAHALMAGDFSTYIGDLNDYRVIRVLADGSGGTYLAGSRLLSNQASEIFVMKLDVAGNIVLFHTISGRGNDAANGLAVDATGNIYLAGSTSSANFPLHSPFQSTPGPGFLVKLSPDASQLLYATYFPAAISALAIDTAGNYYVTGSTTSTAFPVTAGLSAGAVSQGVAGASGAFLTKLSADGSRILYSAVMAGHSKDCGAGSSCFTSSRNTIGVAVAVDAAGGAYLAGNTDTNDLPATPGVLLAKGTGAFVAKVNPAGTAFAYLTYIGALNQVFTPFANPGTHSSAIAVDAAGNAYLAGSTFDPQFPATPGAYQKVYDGPANPTAPFLLPPADAFVAKLNPAGAGVVWASYLGGSGEDTATSIALDASGNVWLSGTTASPDFPNAQGWSQGGDFVAAFNATGSSLPYAARYPDGAASQSLSVDPAGVMHVAGATGLVSTITPGQPPAPRIMGLANAATGPLTGRIAPGELIAIYGPHIGEAGVQLSIGHRVAPVLYVSDSQINAVVPFAVSGTTVAHLVSKTSATSPDFPVTIIAADPQVFRNSDGYAASINQDGSLNSAEHPAKEGDIVAIWATGTGTPPFPAQLADGQIAAGPSDFHCCDVEVMGTPATVLYSGAAPGIVAGVVQINFQVPLLEFFAAQPSLDFTVQVAGQISLPARIYVTQ